VVESAPPQPVQEEEPEEEIVVPPQPDAGEGVLQLAVRLPTGTRVRNSTGAFLVTFGSSTLGSRWLISKWDCCASSSNRVSPSDASLNHLLLPDGARMDVVSQLVRRFHSSTPLKVHRSPALPHIAARFRVPGAENQFTRAAMSHVSASWSNGGLWTGLGAVGVCV
jgi:hypothetical protein